MTRRSLLHCRPLRRPLLGVAFGLPVEALRTFKYGSLMQQPAESCIGTLGQLVGECGDVRV